MALLVAAAILLPMVGVSASWGRALRRTRHIRQVHHPVQLSSLSELELCWRREALSAAHRRADGSTRHALSAQLNALAGELAARRGRG